MNDMWVDSTFIHVEMYDFYLFQSKPSTDQQINAKISKIDEEIAQMFKKRKKLVDKLMRQ